MIETALVFDRKGHVIHWHEPMGRTAGSIPDTRDLWDIIWENRANFGGIAHTHPWDGAASPSGTDLTTFDAIERGLGRTFQWPVVTFTDIVFLLRANLADDFSTLPCPVPSEGSNALLANLEELRNRSR